MANCVFCGKSLSRFMGYYTYPDTPFDYCDDCLAYPRRIKACCLGASNETINLIASEVASKGGKPEAVNEIARLELYKVTDDDAERERIGAELRAAERKREESAERERIINEFGSIQAFHEHEKEQKEISSILITSGFSFDGYRIKRYSGYISGDDCITLPRNTFWGNNSVEKNLCDALVKIRQQALRELKEAAYALDCNAVIGVDFDYLVMDPQHAALLHADVTVYEPYVICVTANGNAVLIEKE